MTPDSSEDGGLADEPATIRELRSALLAFYDRRARDLPWRRDDDPYRILVSEVMLQQTRVETVLGYYEPWLERFPTVRALADADEDEVLKAWEGLGYYRRARNLHRAARMIRERAAADGGPSDPAASGRGRPSPADTGSASPASSAGTDGPGPDSSAGMPTTSGGLRELPGVGEYTAGAVASIAFDEVVPAIDGNARRVLARLFDVPDPKPSWLRDRASALVDPERPGDWNQALMELGATICTPRGPECAGCPVDGWCAARAAGTQAERPAPSPVGEVPRARFALAVLEREGRVLVQKRPREGLLGGMWAFPEERLEGAGAEGGMAGNGPPTTAADAALRIAEGLGVDVTGELRTLKPVRHRYSHLDATYLPVVVPVEPAKGAASGAWPDSDTGSGGPRVSARPGSDTGFGGSRTSAAPGEPGPRERRWIDVDHAATALPTAQSKVLEAWHLSRDAEST